MSEAYILLVYVGVLALGMLAPFVFALGYVWVDAFFPQYVAPHLLGGVPVSLIMAVAAVGSYMLFDRKAPPRPTLLTFLTLAMAAWVTLTGLWAVAPEAAWTKWDWAFKTVVFSVLIPFFFRSRVQIEAMLLVYVFSALAHIFPVGVKAAISGGHYGVDLGLLGNNVALSESSGLATVSIMFIPLYLFFREHSLILPRSKWRSHAFLALVVLDIAAAIGTVARTAVVGFAVLAGVTWLRSRRKLAFGVLVVAAAAGGTYLTSSAWEQRMSTIATYEQENSAYTRILVWRWTLGFVQEHPMGGGFEAYRVNRIEEPLPDGSLKVQYGRAFHSTYFEMLGEHGWPGLLLFLCVLAASYGTLWRVARRSRGVAGLEWCVDLARALQTVLIVLTACCAFIGIGFQPMFWYVFGLATCLREYVRRSAFPATEEGDVRGWRDRGRNVQQQPQPQLAAFSARR